jgi:large subunit ribosomal protein L4
LEVGDQKVLLATTEVKANIYRSAKNLSNVNVREVQSVNTVDILDADAVVFQEGALDWMTDVLSTTEPVAA